MLVGILMLLGLSSAREQVMLSSPGLSIVCSLTGQGKTVRSSDYSYFNPISDADWIWSSQGIVANDDCNITVSFLVHSDNSDITVNISSPDQASFYVNGAFCANMADGAVSANSCFSHIGYHEITFRVTHSIWIYGVAFKIVENYLCPEACPDCMNSQCCPEDFVVEGTNCTCPISNFDSCDCPEGFVVKRISYNPIVYSCESPSPIRSNIVSSQSGMGIDCSLSGSNLTVTSTWGYQAWGNYVWKAGTVSGDVCNITVTYIKHSYKSAVRLWLQASSDSNSHVFVNGKMHVSGVRNGYDITDAFSYIGEYELTLQQQHSGSNSGIAFIVEENYACASECGDCIYDNCCPFNYTLVDGKCGCSESSLSSCSCPSGYQLTSPDSEQELSTCHIKDENDDTQEPIDDAQEEIEIDTQGETDNQSGSDTQSGNDNPSEDDSQSENGNQNQDDETVKHSIVTSLSDLTISCSVTGASKTVRSSAYETYNDLSNADWIWTENGVEDNDHCNVTFQFLRHPLSTIDLLIDGADVMFFYVNEVQCWWGLYEEASSVSISECFDSQGYNKITFQSRHTHGAFGMSFKLEETYSCTDELSYYCMEDPCSIIHGMECIGSMDSTGSNLHTELNQDLNLQGKTTSSKDDDKTFYSEIVVILGAVVGALALLGIFKSCYSYVKRRREGELEIQFLQNH